MTLPDSVSDSLKSSLTPTITEWIDKISNGEGTQDLVECKKNFTTFLSQHFYFSFTSLQSLGLIDDKSLKLTIS